jgi:hypothetical protein
MNKIINISYVEEQGFSPEVVSVFARTSKAAETLKKLMDEREALRNLRRQTRELAKLAA